MTFGFRFTIDLTCGGREDKEGERGRRRTIHIPCGDGFCVRERIHDEGEKCPC